MDSARGNDSLALRGASRPHEPLRYTNAAQPLYNPSTTRVETDLSPLRLGDAVPVALPGTVGDIHSTEIVCYTTGRRHGSPKSTMRLSKQNGRKILTEASLAAAANEWRRQSTLQVIESPDKDVPGETQEGEILPSDSVSAVYAGTAGCESGLQLETSNEDWDLGVMGRFVSEEDFRLNVISWTSKVTCSVPFGGDGFETWHQFDAERHPVTGDLVHPPQAPEVHRDVSLLEDKEMELRRATQTANSACMKQGILVPTRGLEPDQPSDAPEIPQPTVALEPDQSADVLERDKSADARKPSKSTDSSKPDRPATADQPSPAMRIRILLATEKHVDRMRDIYNEEVLKGTQALDREPVSIEDIKELFEASRDSQLPLLVALSDDEEEEDDQVLGMAVLRPRPNTGIGRNVGPYCAQCNIFVQFRYRNRGIGHQLLHSLLTTVSYSEIPREDVFTSKYSLKQGFHNTRNNPYVCESFRGDIKRPDWTTWQFFKVSQPKIHYIYIEIVCGSEDGLPEKKYIQTLTQKFNFIYHGQTASVVHWFNEGPCKLKHMLFYHSCTPDKAALQDGPGHPTDMGIDGPAQPHRTRPASQPVDPSTITWPGRGPRTYWPLRLRHGVPAPVTDDNNDNNQGPVTALATTPFW